MAIGVWGMIADDANSDGIVNQSDINDSWLLEAGDSGYYFSDINLNSQSNNIDKNDFWLSNEGRSTQVPNL